MYARAVLRSGAYLLMLIPCDSSCGYEAIPTYGKPFNSPTEQFGAVVHRALRTYANSRMRLYMSAFRPLRAIIDELATVGSDRRGTNDKDTHVGEVTLSC